MIGHLGLSELTDSKRGRAPRPSVEGLGFGAEVVGSRTRPFLKLPGKELKKASVGLTDYSQVDNEGS